MCERMGKLNAAPVQSDFFDLPSMNARLELDRHRAAGRTRARDMPVTHEEQELVHHPELTDHDVDTECTTDHEAVERAMFLATLWPHRLRRVV